MIFSMNYNTNFMYVVKNKKINKLDDIAKFTNSLDRKLTTNHIPSFDCNFDLINKSIDIVREKSIDYLKTFVE